MKPHRLRQALITTLVQLPVILWQHMFIAMYANHTRHVDYTNPFNLIVLLFMLLATFAVAYKTAYINRHKVAAYGLIAIALAAALLFDSNAYVQFGLFLLYLLLMIVMDYLDRPFTAYRAIAYDKDHTVAREESYKRYQTLDEAVGEISAILDQTLHTLAPKVKSLSELKQRYLQTGNDFRIKARDAREDEIAWSSLWYVQQHAQEIFSQYHKEDKMQEIESFQDLLKRGNLPDDDREVPRWLKIKNDQYEGVDIDSNSVDALISLSKREFLRLFSDASTGFFFTYINTLSQEELERFYHYLETVIVQMPMIEDVDARTWFEEAIKLTRNEEIDDEQKARATLEMPLQIRYIRHIDAQSNAFKQFIQSKYYPYGEKEHEAMQYEALLFKTIYVEEMKYIPDHFEQILSHFRDFYDANDPSHRQIGAHLARRFGVLANALYVIQQAIEEKREGLEWFLQIFLEEIESVEGYDIAQDDMLIFSLVTMYVSIIQEEEDRYISALIDVVKTLMRYYPLNNKAFLYALDQLMKSVALKEISIESANAFLSIFEVLPEFYEILSYEEIMKLKEVINDNLANAKTLENKVFEQEGVKNKMILLNYLVDMEDLYYEGIKEKRAKRYELFLAEYVKLFTALKSREDLEVAGLWEHPVTIDPKWKEYDSIIKDKSTGIIGWRAPVTADIFDMSVEIPICFEKRNGEYLSVGVPLELVELKR